jgi:predicted ester cyclase
MADTPAANKALILAHYDAVTNSHDPDAIRAQVAPDFFDHAAGRAMSADDVIIAEGDLVAARVVWRGVHIGPWQSIEPTGKRVEFRGMTFWRVRDGKITDRWANVDYAGLASQLRG